MRRILLVLALWAVGTPAWAAGADEGAAPRLDWGDVLDTVCEDDFLERLQDDQARRAQAAVERACATFGQCVAAYDRRHHCCREQRRSEVRTRRVVRNGRTRTIRERVVRTVRTCRPGCLRAARTECKPALDGACSNARARLAALLARHERAETPPACKAELEAFKVDDATQEKLRQGTKRTGRSVRRVR
ncbi:MAG: hypothetical protein KC613_16495 [Myxococcales bacterium]|nr:hypothetical protein [Myxococcales bacterium]MCB9525464.1 hypothetical protein [Myxococcales bacterium]